MTAPSHPLPGSLTASLPLALTFDDVLLLPAFSETLPDSASPATRLGHGLVLSSPILSAAMDTVTEAALAIAMARAGGLGVLHKNVTPAKQAQMVAEVKAAAVGAPQGGASPVPTTDQGGRLRVAAAVGVGPAGLERTAVVVAAGVDLVVVDTAHGHSAGVLGAVAAIRQRWPELAIMAGNVCTPEATAALIDAGADIVKVGVGPGSICTTRQVAGVGMPQLSAVAACAPIARAKNRCIIADGGIVRSGDIVKALAAGAAAVMLGSLLAATEEAPGEVEEVAGVRVRGYRGMGSLSAMRAGSADRYFQRADERSNKLVAEGVEARVAIVGSVAETVAQLVGGIRAGMGYLGARDLAALFENARFVRVSPAALKEGGVHDVMAG